MSYDVTIRHEGRYLHAVVSGVESLENVLNTWKEIANACNRQGCTRILCEGCLEGPGPTLDIYEFGKRFVETGIPAGSKIAIVCHENTYGKMKFAETVIATKAPVLTGIFLVKDEALAWLLE